MRIYGKKMGRNHFAPKRESKCNSIYNTYNLEKGIFFFGEYMFFLMFLSIFQPKKGFSRNFVYENSKFLFDDDGQVLFFYEKEFLVCLERNKRLGGFRRKSVNGCKF